MSLPMPPPFNPLPMPPVVEKVWVERVGHNALKITVVGDTLTRMEAYRLIGMLEREAAKL